MFVKTNPGVVINTDDSEYRTILAHREAQKNNQMLAQELTNVQGELRDIREALNDLLAERKR